MPIARQTRTVFETKSEISGRIRVLEDQRERRLVIAGDTLSTYPINGDWSRVEREYWWKALEHVDVPARPSVLMVGLGGGTQVHLWVKGLPPGDDTVYEVRCERPGWSASAGTFRADARGGAYVVLTTAARVGEYESMRIVRRPDDTPVLTGRLN